MLLYTQETSKFKRMCRVVSPKGEWICKHNRHGLIVYGTCSGGMLNKEGFGIYSEYCSPT